MADFCRQCAAEMGFDSGDLFGLVPAGKKIAVLCEGCGECVVDSEGTCLEHAIEAHGTPAVVLNRDTADFEMKLEINEQAFDEIFK